MNPLMILKGAKVFVIVAVMAFGLTVLKTCEKNRVAERDAAITANAEKVSAQANAANLDIANQQLQVIAEAQANALEAAAAARVKIDTEFQEIRQVQNEQKSLLEGNRLNNAVAGRRELIESLANKATRERFDEVEAIFDGT